MSVFVFLGPTLPVDEARRILPASYLPPVAMGDAYRVGRLAPKVVAIIDGFFEQTPAVWHKEILWLLSRGVRVYGASSMGALRAAELQAFGMVGVGEIFEAFARGDHEDDDEVTVVHGPAEDGYQAVSEAMVNLRLGLRLAQARGLITATSHDRLVQAAKASHYPDRSWARLRAEAPALGVPAGEVERLLAMVRQERPDQKRADAVALLRRIAADLETRREPPPAAGFQFEQTSFWDNMVGALRQAGTTDGPRTSVPMTRLLDHVRLLPEARRWREEALLLSLVSHEANRLGLRPGKAQLAGAQERLRRRHGLVSVQRTHAWMEEQRIDKAIFDELVELEALLHELLERQAARVDGYVPFALLRTGQLGEHVDRVQRQWAHLQARGISNPTHEDTGISGDELLHWYQERRTPIRERDLDAHAQALGYGSARAFLNELMATYIYANSGEG